ncbi:hypothetical protein [Micromonospora sp. NPDC047730]|uniref:hypothetical protein n=1 Tax=Micromonospora sp. NPDC047730 TaxID=3364253 RepID=UPI003720DC32
MTTTVSRPGIGLLALERGPGDLSTWRLQQPVTSSAYRLPIAVNILLNGVEDLDHVDLPMIAHVIDDIDHYLVTGLRFVRATMLTDPAWFGLAEDELDPYRKVPAEELPLDNPQLNFYADGEWMLHFQEGRFAVCDPYGLAVVFAQHRPVRLEDLSDAEEID